MNKTTTYFQPVGYTDDGTNIEWTGTPDELFSFQAFATREDCEEWLKNNGYDPADFNIHEYHDEDIEGVTILDGEGNIVEVNNTSDDELNDRIETALIGSDYSEPEAIRVIAETLGVSEDKVRCYDTKIDDGVDGDETEDTYVMMSGFEVEGYDGQVRIYYGDVTEEIGCVDSDLEAPEEEHTSHPNRFLSEDLYNLLTGRMAIEEFQKQWGTEWEYRQMDALLINKTYREETIYCE